MVNEVLFSAPLVISIVLSILLTAYVGLWSRLRVRKLFLALGLEVAFLAITYWMELISTNLQDKLFWNDLEYIVNVTVPPVFLLFVFTFLGRQVVTGRWRALMFVVPSISLFLVWTNDLHHLFYTSVWLIGDGFLMSFGHTYGIGFAIHTTYSLGLLFYGVGLLIYYYIRSSPMQKRQVRLVLVASFIPIIALPLGLLNVLPVSLTYISVIGFTAGIVLIFLGTFMFELFDIVPLATEKILETVDDGIIVATTTGQVVFVNRIVIENVALDDVDLYARPLSFISQDLSRENIDTALAGGRVEVTLGRTKRRIYLLKATPIIDREGTTTALLLTLRDITEEKQISDSLKEANVKLNLLSSITRHDILNQLAVVRGIGELLQERPSNPEQVKKYAAQITESAETIERQFSFARDYQSMGVRAPEWRSAQEMFRRAYELGLASGIEAEVQLDDIELLVDPLIGRVFSVLLDNTRRHGVGATKVWVTASLSDDSLVITYEDNGPGIPDLEKERIFERGYGRSGGLGLYLARQFLDVNGATIRETGVFGKGAKFVITFPPGRWRVGLSESSTAP